MRFQMYPALENQAFMAFAYSNLSAGDHTAKAVAYNADGLVAEALHRSRSRSLRKALSLILMRSI